MGVSCQSWMSANNYLFPIANGFLALTVIIPNNRYALLFLRFGLASSSIFFILWGWLELCSLDTIIWNAALTVIHLTHFIYLLYKMMRPLQFSEINETVYRHVFQPIGVTRRQYKPFAKYAVEHYYPPQGIYGNDGITIADRISIITSGSVLVKKNEQLFHVLRPYEFIDSPEWACGNGDEAGTHQSDLVAGDNGLSLLQWSRKDMLAILMSDGYLCQIFDGLIGRDIAMKLFKCDHNTLTAFQYQKAPVSLLIPHVTNRDVSVLYTSRGHKSTQRRPIHMGCSNWDMNSTMESSMEY